MHTPLYAKFFFPRISSTGEYEDLFLSYVAPYFEYQTAYEIIFWIFRRFIMKSLIDDLYDFCINQLLNSTPTEFFISGSE